MAATVAQDRDRIDRAIHHASWLGAFAMFAYDVLHTIALAAGSVLSWRGYGRWASRPSWRWLRWRCWPSSAPSPTRRPGIRGC